MAPETALLISGALSSTVAVIAVVANAYGEWCRRQTEAQHRAEERMERMRANDFDLRRQLYVELISAADATRRDLYPFMREVMGTPLGDKRGRAVYECPARQPWFAAWKQFNEYADQTLLMAYDPEVPLLAQRFGDLHGRMEAALGFTGTKPRTGPGPDKILPEIVGALKALVDACRRDLGREEGVATPT